MPIPARKLSYVLLGFLLAGCVSTPTPTLTPPPSTIPATVAQPGITSTVQVTPPAKELGTIHSIQAMLEARAAHTATLLPNGSVLLAGGFGQADDPYTASAELYNSATEAFSTTGAMSLPRCCHTATRLTDGRVLIAGGFNGSYLDEAEIYDPATGLMTPTGSLTTARMDHMAVLLDNGEVLLVGGVGTGWTFLASAEIYNPTTGLFRSTGGMSVPRESHTLTKLADGRVLIVGGHTGRHADIVIYHSAEIYDPATGVFELTGPMTVRRHKHDAVLLNNGRVLITGGADEHDDLGAYTSAEEYDPVTGTFSQVGDMPSVRYKHNGTSILLANGTVLLATGAQQAAVFNPQQNIFNLVPGNLGTAPLSRLFSTASLLQNGSVLITGGYGLGQRVTAQAWLYSP